MSHPQDRTIWFSLLLVFASLLCLAAFDPTQRPAIVEFLTQTAAPLLIREVVAGISLSKR